MKNKVLKHTLNVMFYLIVGVFIIYRLPGLIETYRQQGRLAPEAEVTSLNGELLKIPSSSRKQVLVFWATWCGPCKIELGRINQLVQDGEISADQILAISVGESREVVDQHVRDRKYLFPIALDTASQAAEKYKISGTPTVLLVSEDKAIKWAATGINPTLGLRIKNFLK